MLMSSNSFTINELITIASALEDQIDSLEREIAGGEYVAFELISARAFLKYSQSALRKIESMIPPDQAR